jgi:ribose-phosphate pyrophosphokinase
MNKLLITNGSSSEFLARAIAKKIDLPLLKINRRHFPDGEQYVRVMGNVSGKDVALVQSFGMNPDALLIEYSFIVDALKGAGCKRVIAIIPYLAYARQDSRFHHGEPLSIKVIAKFIESIGTDLLITVDMHLHRYKEIQHIFNIPARNLSAMPQLAEYYRRNFGSQHTIVVGPDMESEQWVKAVAENLSAPYTILEKQRLGDRDIKISGELSIGNNRVVLVDDIACTGKTFIEVVTRLKTQGVKRVDALVTHALLVEGALTKLREAGLSKLISTDTVPNQCACVSIASLIADELEKEAYK